MWAARALLLIDYDEACLVDEILYMMGVTEGGLSYGDIIDMTFDRHNRVLTECKKIQEKVEKDVKESRNG